MHIIVTRETSDTLGSVQFRWSVTMKARDATGKRSLGYRGSGTIKEDLTGLEFETGPEVYDEHVPRWTP